MHHLHRLARLIARGVLITRATLQQVAARRVHRVLVAAGILALGASFWPSPAQAIKCSVVNLHWCGVYTCCVQTCTYCYDDHGNLVGDPSCSDPTCWDKYP